LHQIVWIAPKAHSGTALVVTPVGSEHAVERDAVAEVIPFSCALPWVPVRLRLDADDALIEQHMNTVTPSPTSQAEPGASGRTTRHQASAAGSIRYTD
jgi:hypothetical protein